MFSKEIEIVITVLQNVIYIGVGIGDGDGCTEMCVRSTLGGGGG